MADSARSDLDALRAQATALAGGTRDLTQRASVYHHLYAHSGGNHCFPLLAAHGALWAGRYFKAGIRFGTVVARARALVGGDYNKLMSRLHGFAENFRDINRRVCIETFFIYHLTAKPHLRVSAEPLVPADLLMEMDRCHAARAAGRSLSDAERRAFFRAFFLWEQGNIVGPSISEAFAQFDWPLIRHLALRPRIHFAYFRESLPFADFSDTAERVDKGMRAFDQACSTGWDRVERALSWYGIMPEAFSADSSEFFDAFARSVPVNASSSRAFA